MPIQPGTRLGAYEIQGLLGQGAMGMVYRAYHPALARTAAVKVVQALAADPAAVARFEREGQAIAHMRHPNILNVFDFGEFEGAPYMVVEFVEGGNLADRIKSATLDSADSLRILDGVARGIDYAHRLGILHRDIKPANVLMGPDATPILADFGLAKLLQQASMTMSGTTTGTPAYMAPEQVTGDAVGPAADRYAFATMAYELIVGSLPFDADTVMELLYAKVHKVPDPPSTRNRSLPAALDGVLLRGLDQKPEARWPTCVEMSDALAAVMSGRAPAIPAVQAAPTAVPLDSAPAVPLASTPPTPAVAPAPDEVKVATGVIADAAAVQPPAPVSSAPGRRRFAALTRPGPIAAIAAAIVVVAAGGLYLVNQLNAPGAGISSGSVTAGGTVTITVHGVPPGATVDVYIESVRHQIGTFKADSSGKLRADVVVPADEPAGTHDIQLCWSGSCPKTLVVIVTAALVAEVSPSGRSPAATASAEASPSPAESPTPTRAAPSPIATTSVPVVPTPTPPPPSPSPEPTPSPSPTPSTVYHPTIAISPNPVALGGKVTLSGQGFDPNLGGGYATVDQSGFSRVTIGSSCGGAQLCWQGGSSFTWNGSPPNNAKGMQTWTVCQVVSGGSVNCALPVSLQIQ